MSNEEQEMFFFICDISGYTPFMLKNQTDYAHGTLVVKQLLDALIKEVELPMVISKLEGDAIFLYLLKEKIPKEYLGSPSIFGKKILHFFDVFYSKLQVLQNSNDCSCGACSNIGKLDLKIIVHFGKASIDTIGSFQELSGVDVILVHRLLKNQVKENLYLLVTEQAYHHLSLPPDVQIRKSKEEDKDIGSINVYICFPLSLDKDSEKKKPSFFTRLKNHSMLFFGELLLKLHIIKTPHFRNFPPMQDK